MFLTSAQSIHSGPPAWSPGSLAAPTDARRGPRPQQDPQPLSGLSDSPKAGGQRDLRAESNLGRGEASAPGGSRSGCTRINENATGGHPFPCSKLQVPGNATPNPSPGRGQMCGGVSGAPVVLGT